VNSAEFAVRDGNKVDAVEKLRALQAHAERVIGILAPEQKGRPKPVAAAK